MNPTHLRRLTERTIFRQTHPAKLLMMVSADLRAAPPETGKPYAGEQRIVEAYRQLLHIYPYFAQETRSSFWVMLGSAILACATPLLFGWGWLGAVTTVFAACCALVAGYHLFFYKWGPEYIDTARRDAAERELRDTGDAASDPGGLLSRLALFGIACIDGVLSGLTICTAAFQSLLTPTMALLVATAWGVAVTFLIVKLCHAAAREAVINERRELIRALMASNHDGDRERARRMSESAVGDILGQRFDGFANRRSARLVLIGFTICLGLSICALRIGGSESPAAEPSRESYVPAKKLQV